MKEKNESLFTSHDEYKKIKKYETYDFVSAINYNINFQWLLYNLCCQMILF